MKSKIINPKYKEEAFTCPSCSTYSKQDWKYNYIHEKSGEFYGRGTPMTSNCKFEELYICKCEHCGYISFWYKGKLAWPLNSTVEAPIDEMPENIKKIIFRSSKYNRIITKRFLCYIKVSIAKIM